MTEEEMWASLVCFVIFFCLPLLSAESDVYPELSDDTDEDEPLLFLVFEELFSPSVKEPVSVVSEESGAPFSSEDEAASVFFVFGFFFFSELPFVVSVSAAPSFGLVTDDEDEADEGESRSGLWMGDTKEPGTGRVMRTGLGSGSWRGPGMGTGV